MSTILFSQSDLNYKKAVEEAAKQNPDAHFAIIDSVVEQPNVASINYKDQEAAFLAGVAAGLTTKTNKVAFSRWYARSCIRQI